jgi:hypothetical protein
MLSSNPVRLSPPLLFEPPRYPIKFGEGAALR